MSPGKDETRVCGYIYIYIYIYNIYTYIYKCILFSDPIVFVMNPDLPTGKKKKYVQFVFKKSPIRGSLTNALKFN